MQKELNPLLPTIGILLFEGFLSNELVAPLDVFSRPDHGGKKRFNVITIGKEIIPFRSEEGLLVLPDFGFAEAPPLDVLIVPSSMDPAIQVRDQELVDFIRQQNESTAYTASHCAGAFLIGASGIADGHKIVTYCGGSVSLQEQYPRLIVQDDQLNRVVSDGKFISSNGNLVSYPASLDLLEKMTSREHRHFVEKELLIDKLHSYEH